MHSRTDLSEVLTDLIHPGKAPLPPLLISWIPCCCDPGFPDRIPVDEGCLLGTDPFRYTSKLLRADAASVVRSLPNPCAQMLNEGSCLMIQGGAEARDHLAVGWNRSDGFRCKAAEAGLLELILTTSDGSSWICSQERIQCLQMA